MNLFESKNTQLNTRGFRGTLVFVRFSGFGLFWGNSAIAWIAIQDEEWRLVLDMFFFLVDLDRLSFGLTACCGRTFDSVGLTHQKPLVMWQRL